MLVPMAHTPLGRTEAPTYRELAQSCQAFVERHPGCTNVAVIVDVALDIAMSLSDTVRPHAKKAISRLQKFGCTVVMITGDSGGFFGPENRVGLQWPRTISTQSSIWATCYAYVAHLEKKKALHMKLPRKQQQSNQPWILALKNS